MRVNRPGGEPSGLLIGERAEILGISLERGANVCPPRFLALLTGTRLWTAQLFCFALFPLEGGKTSIVS